MDQEVLDVAVKRLEVAVDACERQHRLGLLPSSSIHVGDELESGVCPGAVGHEGRLGSDPGPVLLWPSEHRRGGVGPSEEAHSDPPESSFGQCYLEKSMSWVFEARVANERESEEQAVP